MGAVLTGSVFLPSCSPCRGVSGREQSLWGFFPVLAGDFPVPLWGGRPILWPMAIMTRYILRQLLAGLVVVTLGLLGMVWLSQSLRFITLIVEKGLGLGTFLVLTGLMLPEFLASVLPLAVAAVVLFTYNRLLADRELTVLQAAGLGPARTGRAALLLAVAVLAVGEVLTTTVIPASAFTMNDMRWRIRNGLANVLLEEGRFMTVMPGVTVYVRQRERDGTMRDVVVHDSRNRQNPETFMATQGALVPEGDGGLQVVLEHGSRQQANPETGQFSILYFQRYAMALAAPRTEGLRNPGSSERPLRDLLTADPATLSPDRYRQFQAEAHRRLSAPLLSLTFTLIALAALLSGTFDRRGQGRRLLAAAALVAGVQGSYFAVLGLAETSLAALPLLYAVVLVPAALAAWCLWAPPARPRTGV